MDLNRILTELPGPKSNPRSFLSPFVRVDPKRPNPAPKSSIYLPNEIILQILSHFTSADAVRSEDGSYRKYCSLCHLNHLYTSCLISKTWNEAATVILYSNLKLDLDGTCEYHWRGIPWGDGKLWWTRRNLYLKNRYLKLLLRTLTARSDLAQYFRTIEIDIHYHMLSDYKVFPLYKELFVLCSNLTSIIGDPCIFFCPSDNDIPSCQESRSRHIANRLSGGHVHKCTHAQISKQQKELQEVLSRHTAWRSWEINGCQGMYPPFLPTNWKNLKHLSIKDFHFSISNLHSNPDTDTLSLGSLDSLESLSLSNSSLNILEFVPDNQLIALTIEAPDAYVSDWSSFTNLKKLWKYLSRGSGPSSKLQRLSISIPAQHASLTEKWLSRTLSFTQNIRELRLSAHHEVDRNHIVLRSDPGVEELSLEQPFPICPELQKLWFMFPGWTHNELLVKLLSKNGGFPKLANLGCFRSNVVVELKVPEFWYWQWESEVSQASKDEGASVDRQLELELIGKRGMHRVMDPSTDWRRAYFGRVEKVR